jgi:hypothetical protein
MYTTGYVLKTDADFDNMIMFMLPVEVYRGEELLFTGIMIRHSEFVTRFAPRDQGFVKMSHEFRIH